MTGILSLITFLPLVGVAVLLGLRLTASPANQAKTENAAKWITLAFTVADLLLAVVLLANFDRTTSGFQFVEQIPWFSGVSYSMGVDGISILFVLLTAFLLPICIAASWKSIEKRVLEYLIAFLVLEVLVIGVFCAMDLILFYIFFEGGLLPMFLIIGIFTANEAKKASHSQVCAAGSNL